MQYMWQYNHHELYLILWYNIIHNLVSTVVYQFLFVNIQYLFCPLERVKSFLDLSNTLS